ncbi:MAG: DNA mismatch repair protein MutL [Fusobacteriia bacterium 4572_132]|nr:MAG: DNA mismatch repair protein MutL [Fusobacteriia bacterium 4572_132]
MRKINILDESVANVIAAGEVVENPASMIKELVENSLDARAKKIKIEVEKNGRNVKIIDDGEGMIEEDLYLSIERHATSKILTKEDIFNVNTYGFRGEALASIASVSKMILSSRIEEEKIGMKLNIIAGNIKKAEEVVKNRGTEIEIKSLFYNTPARLKFLRTKNTEYTKIRDIVLKEALVNYNTGFSLIIDNKEIIKTSGNGLESTVLELFGKRVLKNIKKFKYGYLGNLELLKSNKNHIFTYINSRYAKSAIVEKAVIDAYYTKLGKGKYPFAIVFLELDPKKIDVNVHPSKKIVKFSNGGLIYKTVKEEIEKILYKEERNIMPVFKIKEEIKKKEEVKLPYLDKNEIREIQNKDGTNLKKKYFEDKNKAVEIISEETEIKNSYFVEKETIYEKQIERNKTENGKAEEMQLVQEKNEITYNNIKKEVKKENEEFKEDYKILGQLKNMYVLVETKKGLEIYDQHIIHERILYEELKEKYYSKKIKVQKLLAPINIELDYTEKILVLEKIELFKEFGFEIEDFGENQILIREVPSFDWNESIKNIFNELLQNILNEKNIQDIREKIIISMSCKGAIKAGEKLEKEEIEILLKKLHKIGKYTCPHGRPIIVNLPFLELEKRFHRK